MSKYVEKNLMDDEQIIKKAEFNKLRITFIMIGGIVFFFLLFIPLIKAISEYVKFKNLELAVTNKRVIAKRGVFDTKAYSARLDKVQNITVSQNFWGKVFKYSTIDINTANESEEAFRFKYVKDADQFKLLVAEVIDKGQKEALNAQILKLAADLVKDKDSNQEKAE